MKLIGKMILIALFTYPGGFILPWWGVALVAFVICFFIPGTGIGSFVSGFLGGGIVWLVYSWYLDIQSQSIMSSKIILLFPFEDKMFLVLLTGVIGAICGAFGGLSGNSFRLLFQKKKAESFYS